MNPARTVLLGVLAIVLVSGCGGTTTASPSPSAGALGVPSPPPTAAAPSASEGSISEPAPSEPTCEPGTVCSGELQPGTYTSTTLGPTITFELGPGWQGFPDIADVGFGMIRNDLGNASGISVTWFPGTVFEPGCDPQASEIEAAPRPFVDWLAAHPDLEATAPAPVTVAGVDGWMIDVNSSVPAECTEPPWIFLWELPTVGDFHLADDEQARLILLDAGDLTIAIVAESYPGSDHVGLLELTDAILSTMTITP